MGVLFLFLCAFRDFQGFPLEELCLPKFPGTAGTPCGLAGPGGACAKLANDLVPAVCRAAVSPQMPLGAKVRAHKALAACLERPAATPDDVVRQLVVPALHASVKKVDGHPALAMCVLGCYDVVAKRLPERGRITRAIL